MTVMSAATASEIMDVKTFYVFHIYVTFFLCLTFFSQRSLKDTMY